MHTSSRTVNHHVWWTFWARKLSGGVFVKTGQVKKVQFCQIRALCCLKSELPWQWKHQAAFFFQPPPLKSGATVRRRFLKTAVCPNANKIFLTEMPIHSKGKMNLRQVAVLLHTCFCGQTRFLVRNAGTSEPDTPTLWVLFWEEWKESSSELTGGRSHASE